MRDYFCTEEEINRQSCSSDNKFKLVCAGQKLTNGCYPRLPIYEGDCENGDVVAKNKIEAFSSESRCFVSDQHKAFCLKTKISEDKLYLSLGGN